MANDRQLRAIVTQMRQVAARATELMMQEATSKRAKVQSLAESGKKSGHDSDRLDIGDGAEGLQVLGIDTGVGDEEVDVAEVCVADRRDMSHLAVVGEEYPPLCAGCHPSLDGGLVGVGGGEAAFE